MDNTVGSLTEVQKSVVIGCLLGDGYLRQLKGRRNAFLEINHSFKQKDYVDWKYSVLKNICKSGPKSRKYSNRVAYRFYTKAHLKLTELLEVFYKDGKKQVPDFDMDPLVLAVWFMDDGSMVSESDVYLNTQQFSDKDQRKLLKKLALIGIIGKLNKDKQYKKFEKLLKEAFYPIASDPKFLKLTKEWKEDNKYKWDTSIPKIIDNLIVGSFDKK